MKYILCHGSIAAAGKGIKVALPLDSNLLSGGIKIGFFANWGEQVRKDQTVSILMRQEPPPGRHTYSSKDALPKGDLQLTPIQEYEEAEMRKAVGGGNWNNIIILEEPMLLSELVTKYKSEKELRLLCCMAWAHQEAPKANRGANVTQAENGLKEARYRSLESARKVYGNLSPELQGQLLFNPSGRLIIKELEVSSLMPITDNVETWLPTINALFSLGANLDVTKSLVEGTSNFGKDIRDRLQKIRNFCVPWEYRAFYIGHCFSDTRTYSHVLAYLERCSRDGWEDPQKSSEYYQKTILKTLQLTAAVDPQDPQTWDELLELLKKLDNNDRSFIKMYYPDIADKISYLEKSAIGNVATVPMEFHDQTENKPGSSMNELPKIEDDDIAKNLKKRKLDEVNWNENRSSDERPTKMARVAKDNELVDKVPSVQNTGDPLENYDDSGVDEQAQGELTEFLSLQTLVERVTGSIYLIYDNDRHNISETEMGMLENVYLEWNYQTGLGIARGVEGLLNQKYSNHDLTFYVTNEGDIEITVEDVTQWFEG